MGIWEQLSQALFRRCQNALETDQQKIANQVGANVFWAPPHVVLLMTTNGTANGGFDLTLTIDWGIGNHCWHRLSVEEAWTVFLKNLDGVSQRVSASSSSRRATGTVVGAVIPRSVVPLRSVVSELV